MVRKKVDNRIRVLIENGVISKRRNLFVIVGDKGRDQVVILHHMLSKAVVKARPSVLWCYKKELGFSRYILCLFNFLNVVHHAGPRESISILRYTVNHAGWDMNF